MSAAPPVFGERCVQHADQGIALVTRTPVQWRGGTHWLVTARYGCGHQHTQHCDSPPLEATDTAGRHYPVTEPPA